MLDKLTYISSTGATIKFGDTESHILINTNDFRDYEWNFSQSYKRITNFNKNLVTRSLPILIYGKDTKEIANTIFEIVENDVLLDKYGKIYSGDYYMQGNFIASRKTNYTADGFLSLVLTFVTDRPYWVRETGYQYRPSTISQDGLSYPYDYDYDYLSSINAQDVINPSFAEQNIRIIIYGDCTNPSVMIDDHLYSLELTLLDDEYVTIDTAEKTIVLTKSDGTTENVFNTRNRDSYIFQKVSSGKHVVSVLPLGTNADLTILEERSEPLWQ